jgi:phosphoribosylaminoimidazole-succinocarboxamide synthase
VAGERNIILADTKFEFGHLPSGELLLIDEVLTPDSSRFWPKETYAVGHGQPSLDKQPIRDWLEGLEDWDKTPPAPDLPPEVVNAASERYQDVFRRLAGVALSAYVPPRFGTDR